MSDNTRIGEFLFVSGRTTEALNRKYLSTFPYDRLTSDKLIRAAIYQHPTHHQVMFTSDSFSVFVKVTGLIRRRILLSISLITPTFFFYFRWVLRRSSLPLILRKRRPFYTLDQFTCPFSLIIAATAWWRKYSKRSKSKIRNHQLLTEREKGKRLVKIPDGIIIEIPRISGI